MATDARARPIDGGERAISSFEKSARLRLDADCARMRSDIARAAEMPKKTRSEKESTMAIKGASRVSASAAAARRLCHLHSLLVEPLSGDFRRRSASAALLTERPGCSGE